MPEHTKYRAVTTSKLYVNFIFMLQRRDGLTDYFGAYNNGIQAKRQNKQVDLRIHNVA